MTIYIDYDIDNNDKLFDFDYENIARLVINKVLTLEHFPYEVEVSISFVDEDAIRAINQEYRSIDKPTDVLSFPMIDYDEGFSLIRDRTKEMYSFIDEGMDYYNPDTREVALGDIVLCVPYVYSQSNEYNHSILREYAFLITHSMLHLLGFDHIDDNERVIMEDKQTKILESLNITRDS